jgi:hypothetical protein
MMINVLAKVAAPNLSLNTIKEGGRNPKKNSSTIPDELLMVLNFLAKFNLISNKNRLTIKNAIGLASPRNEANPLGATENGLVMTPLRILVNCPFAMAIFIW